MLEVMLLIPLVLFAFLVLATRYSWKVIFLLLLVGPFLATALLIAGAVAFTDIGGLPPSFRDWVSFILTAYFFIFSMAIIYPRSAYVGIFALLACVIYERFPRSRTEDRAWRILLSAGLGAAGCD